MKIVELLVILGLTFWFALFLLAGILLTAGTFGIVAPLQVPPALAARLAHYHLSVPANGLHALGYALLAIGLGYLLLSALFRGRIRIWHWEVPVPPFGLTFCQYAIAVADFFLAAAVLYVLLPKTVDVGFFFLLEVYIFAYVAEVLSHVPGGWGVFDVVIIGLLPPEQRVHVFASILLFRVVYRIGPVLTATVLFAANEVALRRDELGWLLHIFGPKRQLALQPDSARRAAEVERNLFRLRVGWHAVTRRSRALGMLSAGEYMPTRRFAS